MFGPKITAFLSAIRVQPNVTKAAVAAGINKASHYKKLLASAEYRKEFDKAWKAGCDALSDIAVERAAIGWQEPIIYQGNLCYPDKWDEEQKRFVPNLQAPPLTITKIDNRLLEFVLSRRHPDYREKLDVDATVSDKRFSGTMEDLLALYGAAQAKRKKK